jgi:hypothetical protein
MSLSCRNTRVRKFIYKHTNKCLREIWIRCVCNKSPGAFCRSAAVGRSSPISYPPCGGSQPALCIIKDGKYAAGLLINLTNCTSCPNSWRPLLAYRTLDLTKCSLKSSAKVLRPLKSPQKRLLPATHLVKLAADSPPSEIFLCLSAQGNSFLHKTHSCHTLLLSINYFGAKMWHVIPRRELGQFCSRW